MGTKTSFPGVKLPGCEADRSPPSSAEVRNAWIYTSTPQYTFMDNFTFTFIIISSIGIALGYGQDDRGSRVRFPAGAGNFSLHHRVQNGSGPTQPPIQWEPGALSLGVKRPGREADHSTPSSAELKEWVDLYLHSPIRLHGVVLS
jgi:hypothetical protein